MDPRRVYYDHEPAYRKIKEKGGRGWDDLKGNPANDSYVGLERFLAARSGPRGRALDLGCGGGQASVLLARAGYDVLGVDFSETAVELARRNAPGCRFEVRDALDASWVERGAFALVVDNHALHCITEPQHRRAFLTTVREALSPDGILFSETMTAEGGFDPRFVDADPSTRVARNGTRFWVREGELRAEVEAAGLRVLLLELKEQPPGEGSLGVLHASRATR